jgi:hypothetical protein
MITTPSGFMKDALARHVCPADKIACKIRMDNTACAGSPEKAVRAVRVLSVARFAEKKAWNIPWRIRQPRPDRRLYASWDTAPLKKTSRHGRTLGVGRQGGLSGQINNDAVRREIGRGRLLALTSVTAANGDQEGVPVSLFAAQGLGLPWSAPAPGFPNWWSTAKPDFWPGNATWPKSPILRT